MFTECFISEKTSIINNFHCESYTILIIYDALPTKHTFVKWNNIVSSWKQTSHQYQKSI